MLFVVLTWHALLKKAAMNTKTMRLPPRRGLTHTPASGASSKRKERDDFDPMRAAKSLKPTPTSQAGSDEAAEPASSNHLLAGYLAHEYLTKGTLFGEPWDPARAQAVQLKGKPIQRVEAEPSKGAGPDKEKKQRYVEVANLLKTDGAHLAGIVNPTHLARFLQM